MLSLTLAGCTMDLHNLIKIPELIEHYQEHRKRFSDFSFFDFLGLHYGRQASQHDQDEHGKHRNLPFKSGTCTFTHVFSIISIFKAFEIISTGFSFSYSNFYQSISSADFSESIWQPPRI